MIVISVDVQSGQRNTLVTFKVAGNQFPDPYFLYLDGAMRFLGCANLLNALTSALIK